MLSGLTRVREFIMDDAHIFLRRGSDRRGGRAAAAPGAARLRRLRPDAGDEAVDPAGGVPRRDRRPGTTPRRELKKALERRRRGVHGQRGRRRVLRPEDRLRRHRRDRPQVAVRDDSARLPAAAAVRAEVHRRRQHRAPPGRDSPGDLRQLRAVHRAAARALRRRACRSGSRRCRSIVLPIADRHLAYAADGARPAGGGRPRASSWTSGRRRLDIRSARRSCRRCPTCWSSGDREAAEQTVSVRSRAGGRPGGAGRSTTFVAGGARRSAPQG